MEYGDKRKMETKAKIVIGDSRQMKELKDEEIDLIMIGFGNMAEENHDEHHRRSKCNGLIPLSA